MREDAGEAERGRRVAPDRRVFVLLGHGVRQVGEGDGPLCGRDISICVSGCMTGYTTLAGAADGMAPRLRGQRSNVQGDTSRAARRLPTARGLGGLSS